MKQDSLSSYEILQSIVAPYELSVKLKNAGLYRKTAFEWIDTNGTRDVVRTDNYHFLYKKNYIPAPTLEEVELPEDIVIVEDTNIGKNYIVCEIVSQIHDKGVIAFEIEMIKELGLFPTKLQAACEAWLWAKKREANETL